MLCTPEVHSQLDSGSGLLGRHGQLANRSHCRSPICRERQCGHTESVQLWHFPDWKEAEESKLHTPGFPGSLPLLLEPARAQETLLKLKIRFSKLRETTTATGQI